MSKSVITDSLLTAIADAIRAKTGETDSMTPAEMAQAIEDIPAGAEEPYVEYTLDEQLGVNFTGAVFHGFTKIPRFFSHHTSLDRGGLVHVDIPEGVTEICDYAFVYDSLSQGITLPDSLRTIGTHSFEGCSLPGIVLPDGLESIGAATFQNCQLLQSCAIPAGIQSINSGSLFMYCSALASINFPPAWTEIGNDCFAGCTHLDIAEIPAHVTEIGNRAFQTCTALTELDIMGAVSIYNNAFSGCTGLTEVRFHDTAASISSSAFKNDTALRDIYVPWASGAVSGAPWGATNASIHYNTQYDSEGNVIS